MGIATHWDEQALTVTKPENVNISDIYQRELEYQFIMPHLKKNMSILEVGCGNGYSTQQFKAKVKHIDAFDISENMIARAKEWVPENNARFFVDSILEPKCINQVYDAVICVRVIINLKNLDEQKRAISNLKSMVAKNGILILVEGYSDGFYYLSKEREAVGMPPIVPSHFNYYSSINNIAKQFDTDWLFWSRFHTGFYDWMTRVYYPMVVGHGNVGTNTEYHQIAQQLSYMNSDQFSKFARVWGFVIRRLK